MPKISLLDPRSHAVEAVAVLDALANIDLSWNILKQGVGLVTDYVERIPLEVLQFDSTLRGAMERLAHMSDHVEAFLEAVLPLELWNWFEHSALMEFARAVQAKIEALDAGHIINFHPEGVPADFDFSMHFPWITAILSSAREVRLLSRNDTTIGRALTHVALDVVAVSTGAYLATGVGAMVLTVAAAALDVTVSAGLATFLLGLCGVGGAVVGAKTSRKIKKLKLETLSERYAREVVDVASQVKVIEGNGRKRLQQLRRTLEQRRATLCTETERAWRSEAKRVCEARDAALREFAQAALPLVRSHLVIMRDRLQALDTAYARRRRFIWWPTATNVRLWIERRFTRETVVSLTRTVSQLELQKTATIATVWPVLRHAVEDDPLVMLAPALARCAQMDQNFAQQLRNVDAQHREVAQRHFSNLKSEFDKRTAEILTSVNAELRPVLAPLRELDDELCREAAALGMRRRAA